MTAYFFGAMKTHDLGWMAGYQANVPAIMRRHGGEYVAVSKDVRRCEGDGFDPDAIVLATFPSMEAIDAFLSDADYRPYRAARLAATSGEAFAFAARD
jgi:uncharacterized protein (DUF1330 family)